MWLLAYDEFSINELSQVLLLRATLIPLSIQPVFGIALSRPPWLAAFQCVDCTYNFTVFVFLN